MAQKLRKPKAMAARRDEAYLDLVKRSVTNYVYLGGSTAFKEYAPTGNERYNDHKWNVPRYSQPNTLLFAAQLDLLETLIVQLERDEVPGDLIEAGVWRGGAVIFMRAVLETYAITGRIVYAADSFQGIPRSEYRLDDPVDAWQDRWVADFDEVRANVSRYGLLDDQFRFIRGLFNQSLPAAGIGDLALIRLDADSYESTMDALIHLYPKLSLGGAIVIDDWHLPGCKAAVTDFRERYAIRSPIVSHPANEYWIKK